MMCARCGGLLTAVVLSLGGSPAVMRSCSECKQTWWERDGEATSVDDVLDLVTSATGSFMRHTAVTTRS